MPDGESLARTAAGVRTRSIRSVARAWTPFRWSRWGRSGR